MRMCLTRWAGVLPGVVLAVVAWQGSALGAVAAPAAKGTKTLQGVLPKGRVGQEYQTRIHGIILDVGGLQCDPKPVLPAGLALDCRQMLIYGHPEAVVTGDAAKPNVTFTVGDGNNSYQVNLTLTVLDGPDEVTVAPPPAGKKAPAAGAPVAAVPPVGPHPAPVEKGKAQTKHSGAAMLEGGPEAEQPQELEEEPTTVPARGSAAVQPPAPRSSPSARVVPAVSVVSHGSLAAEGVSGAASGAVPGPVSGSIGGAAVGAEHLPKQVKPIPGVGIVIDPETPVAEGAATIKGRITNDTEMISGLCVGLKQHDVTGDSYAEVTARTDSKCPSVYVPADTSNEFMLTLKEPLRAGVTYTFDVWSMTTLETITVNGSHDYKIHRALPKPTVEVTSLIRDNVKTITGTCNNLPNPAVATNATAKPPVTGNLPRVAVQIHEPDAANGEWSTALLSVGKGTALSDEATATADGCTFSVTLNTPLTAGEKVRVKLTAPSGRHFVMGGVNFTEVTWPAGADVDDKKGVPVFTALAVSPPVITSEIKEGSSSITGTATPSPTNGATVTIAAISDDDYLDKRGNTDIVTKPIYACRSSDEMTEYSGRFLPITGSAATSTAGAFTLTLASPLQDGQRFHLVEVLPAHSQLTAAEKDECKTTVTEVKGELDWGRIHADFVGGVLISNDSTNSTVTTTPSTGTGAASTTTAGAGNFSQAHQFLALNVEKSWALPGCYLRVFAHSEVEETEKGEVGLDPNGKPIVNHVPDQCFDVAKGKLFDAKKSQHLVPGFSTYFQTRLTAIPVSMVSTTSGANAGTVSSMGGNLISSAQTARVEVGTYFPFFITRWEYDHKPNALFFAPLAKTGFDTVTGPSTVSTTSVGGATTQTQSYEQVYTYWSYGARIGHMELSRSETKAPETFSYLDIAIGPYSSLQSYVCHSNFETTAMAPTGSECDQYTHSPFHLTNPIDSRKRLYRFDIEGLLKIPKTILYVGLNANIGQKTLGASQLDHGFAAPDDIRFLFGTKFDIASVLTKFKLGPQ